MGSAPGLSIEYQGDDNASYLTFRMISKFVLPSDKPTSNTASPGYLQPDMLQLRKLSDLHPVNDRGLRPHAHEHYHLAERCKLMRDDLIVNKLETTLREKTCQYNVT